MSLVSLLLGACSTTPERPDVVLVTIDTLRADALGARDGRPSVTPTLDGLAAKGWVATDAMTAAPYTLPSHASLLTGRLPADHGIHRNGAETLPSDTPTLAGVLAGEGWTTGAFVSAAVLDGNFGLDVGFDHYDDGPFAGSQGQSVPERRANGTVDAATAWILEQPRDAPLFLWVHLYDPHQPYVTPHAEGEGYRQEIAFADAQVGKLLAMRDSWRERPRVVAVVADHGEGLGDHGEQTHGWFVYRSTMHVPWILEGTGVPKKVHDAPVSTVDLPATLLGLAGVGTTALPGSDVLADPSPRVAIGESFGPWYSAGMSPLYVAREGERRVILAPRPELYDLAADPAESTPAKLDASAQALLDRLRDTHRRSSALRPGASDLPEPLARQLEALGYTEGEGASFPEALEGLGDPKDAPGALAILSRTVDAARRVPPDEGVALLQDALVRFPTAQVLHGNLVRGLVASGDLAAAREAAAGLGLSPNQAKREIAVLLLDLDRPQSVLALLGEPGPDTDPDTLALTAEALRRTGRCDEALALLDRQAGTGGPLESAVRGACLVTRGALTESLPHLEAAVASGGAAEMEDVLGEVLLATGRIERAIDVLRRVHARRGTAHSAERLGLALSTVGRHPEAARLFEEGAASGTGLSWQGWAAWAECERLVSGYTLRRCDLVERARLTGAPLDVLSTLEAPAGEDGCP